MPDNEQKAAERGLQQLLAERHHAIDGQRIRDQTEETTIYLQEIPGLLTALKDLTGLPLDALLSIAVSIAEHEKVHLRLALRILVDFHQWQRQRDVDSHQPRRQQEDPDNVD